MMLTQGVELEGWARSGAGKGRDMDMDMDNEIEMVVS